MPYIKITSSVSLPDEKIDSFLATVSKAVSEVTGKPEKVMMVAFDTATIMFDRQSGPGAFVDVRAIGGLTPQTNGKLSARLCAVIKEGLGIPGDKVYLTFIDVPATNWGMNGATFG